MDSVGMEVKRILGLGSTVRGLGNFPWMAANFYLKDDLGLSSSTYQLIKNFVELPVVVKPICGVLSDAVYVRGEHRLPYISIGVALQAISWFLLALVPKSSLTVSTIFTLLIMGNFGLSISDVASDAIVVEIEQQTRSHGLLGSFVSMLGSFGSIVGYLLGGIAIKQLPPQTNFALYALLLTFQFLIIIVVPEQRLNLRSSLRPLTVVHRRSPRRQQQFILSTNYNNSLNNYYVEGSSSSRFSSIYRQLHELSDVLQRPEIFYSICWLATSYAIVPDLSDTMFYYRTKELGLDVSVLTLSRVFEQGYLFAWNAGYNRWLNRFPPRRVIYALQGMSLLTMVSDVLLVKGVHRYIGISDSTYVIVFSSLFKELYYFKMLPFSILMAQLCPIGCEGSLMAFVWSALALSCIASGFSGAAFAAVLGISGDGYSRLVYGILIETACTGLPIYWSFWLFESEEGKQEKKDD